MNCICKSLACLVVLSLVSSTGILAQIKERIPPKSILFNLERNVIPTFSLKALDYEKLRQQDEANTSTTRDLRFAIPTDVNLNTQSHGQWKDLGEDGRIWRLTIESPNALATILKYDKFYLPAGATLHLYNEDRSHLVGAFTSKNNTGSADDPEPFLTELIRGSSVTLEYFEPYTVGKSGIISISTVMQAYRDVNYIKKYKGFDDSGNCQVNINCPDGNSYQSAKLSVSRMLLTRNDGSFWCTGQLMNSGQGNFNPIYLTADHCLGTTYDATGNNSINAIFYWDYEAVGCSNPASEPSSISTSGAMLMANKGDSDFALFWLTEDPFRDAGFVPSYFGYDAGSPSAGGACVHHPAGDIKKISLYTQTPTNNHPCAPDKTWSVIFNHGGGDYSSTEGGSSGSALIDDAGRVIGQLWGGIRNNSPTCSAGPECADPDSDLSYYGKFSDSWGDTGGKRRRLSDWLSPSCSQNVSHASNVTNTAEFFVADNAVTSSAGIFDNSSARSTVVMLNGGNRVDLINGFQVGANANLTILNTADCPAGRESELQSPELRNSTQPTIAGITNNESIEQ